MITFSFVDENLIEFWIKLIRTYCILTKSTSTDGPCSVKLWL